MLSAGVVALSAAPAAAADTTVVSSNWAGYAVHRQGESFHLVTAAWQQPYAQCKRGKRTYSAMWVGLGGYSETSQSLEQTGTEVDCSAQGKARSSAWYELVPAASKPIHFPVRPGDHVAASVTVTGHTVVVALRDVTTNHAFRKTLHPSAVDVSSADWVVEAPSDCSSMTSCQPLPLADFGSATFTFARAQSTNGHIGAVTDPAWNTTKVLLRPGSRRFVGNASTVGVATPSPLHASGTSFSITYSTEAASTTPSLATRRTNVFDGYLVHPGR